MGSAVIGHGREGMAFVFRMPMIEVVRCHAAQRTLPQRSHLFPLDKILSNSAHHLPTCAQS
ncbi:hypothetical protein [Mastigocladopsis repens]|uniref:hypothetical protein n=1 Tax=Mastigocladopsis repens TaxID=221287 RepID=UPI0002F4C4EB|nr:hypothetical protein [Mastigocladopsis repens]